MPTTRSFSVSYTDQATLPGYGYRESAEAGVMEVVRPCWVAWRDLRNFYRSMLGFSTTEQKTVWYPPENHPRHRNLYAARIEMHTPAGIPQSDSGRGNFITFDSSGSVVIPPPGAADTSQCQLEVIYKNLPYTVPNTATWQPTSGAEALENFVERNANFAIQNLSLNGLAFKWADGTTAITNAAALVKLIPSMQLHYKRYGVTRIPYATIEANLGKVNSAIFDAVKPPGDGIIPGIGNFATETLLFTGVDFERQNTLEPLDDHSGPFNWTWNVTYQFAYMFQTWNKIFRASKAGQTTSNANQEGPFFRVVDYPTGTYGIYRTFDFHDLFNSLST